MKVNNFIWKHFFFIETKLKYHLPFVTIMMILLLYSALTKIILATENLSSKSLLAHNYQLTKPSLYSSGKILIIQINY